ncbi:L10-interacting MYB domain-containing protein-like isoform X2 [Phoenix dactylifera]|uniref:L10-interacting MYB domain-containing protein-like isoform X2 n=1 Tax=Phoenix dactylifera TaxID=42345 RepID=A0A8B7C8C5_PHODC|nr:L10-interacting MYB domain-containing protein-like isoform X2 [Phoenix dactylifera]
MSRMDSKSGTKLKRKEVATANQARVYWTREHDRVLIDLMVEQTLAGARVGAGFTRDAWFDMVDRFNERTRLRYDVDHLKNRLRFYKREYRIVSAIKNHAGFSWDHKMQMVTADDAEWDEYVRKNPEAKLYRTRQTPFINELEVTFGSSASKSNGASSSRIHYGERNDTNGNLGEGDGTLNSFADTPQTSNDPMATSADIHAEVPQDVPEAENFYIRRAAPLNILRGNSRKSRRQSDDALLALREIAEASKRRISAEEAKDEKLSLLDECLEELNLMKDIDNELYVKALFIFKEEYNQHIFLKTTETEGQG